jgi:YaiO family outer membrane protein
MFVCCVLSALCGLGDVHAQNADARSTRVLFEQAKPLEASQRYGDAIAIYREILLLEPENDEIRAALARLLSWQGSYAEAVDLYRDILRRHPVDLDIRTALARVLSWQKHVAEARQLYEGVLQENPRHAEALQGLADLFYWEGRPEEALGYYERAYAVSSDPAVAARMEAVTAALEASPQAPLGLRDSIIRLPYRDYLKLGYGHFSYSQGIPDERNVLIELAKSIGAQTLIARVEPLNRFGLHNTPVSAELYSPLWRKAWGYLAAQGTIDADFAPNYSITGELSQGLGIAHPLLSMIEASFAYRRLSYRMDDINLLVPGLTVFLPFNVWVTEKLFYVPETGALTLASRLTWRPTDRLQLFASGSFGTSGERIVATQDLARVSSRTFQGGITFPVTERISLEAIGFYEDRGILYVRRGGDFNIIYHW